MSAAPAPAQDDTQRALAAMADAFGRAEIAPHAVAWDRDEVLPLATLRRAADLGMGAVYAREEHGGSGLSRLDAVLIFTALARGCPSVAAFLSIHNLATWTIDRFGPAPLRARLVPRLATMELVASFCLTEPGCGSDAAALATRAVRNGDSYVVDGTKQFISGAGTSDIYVTLVRTGGPGPDGITALVVPRDTEGLSFGPNERKMGWKAQPTRAVIFHGCRVPVSHRLGAEGEGFAMAMQGLDGGRLNIAACSLGGAEAALEKALAYMAERLAFGQRLDAFQALQFKLADMATTIEACRAMLHAAAQALDRGDADATVRIAMVGP